MDSLDESLDETASCSSARASWPPLAKLSEVRYCRDGVLTTVVLTKDERDDTGSRRCVSTRYAVTLLTKHWSLTVRQVGGRRSQGRCGWPVTVVVEFK